MRTAKAGLATKLVILVLLAASAIALLDVRGQIRTAQAEKDAIETQVAQQAQVNADLADAVDHSGDPERQEEIARAKLGLISPGEKVFIYTD